MSSELVLAPAASAAPDLSLKRYIHWPQLLHEFLASRFSPIHESDDGTPVPLPFAWGRHDCSLFVADSINAMTGVDLGTNLRGQYSSLAGALVTIAKVTGKQGATVEDLAEHFAATHHMPERQGPLFAQRGDVVLFDSEMGTAMGIVRLDGQCLFVAQSGLHLLPLQSCRRAWKV